MACCRERVARTTDGLFASRENQLLSALFYIARKILGDLQRLFGDHLLGLGVDGRDPIEGLYAGDVIHPSAKTKWWETQEAN